MKILVFTSLLPSVVKPNNNDILLLTAENHMSYRPDVEYKFILLVPYTNFLLSKISKKWKGYYDLKKRRQYNWKGQNINVIDIPMFGTSLWLTLILIKIGYFFCGSRIKAICDDFNPDVVHAHNVLIDTYLAYKLYKHFNFPYVITDRSIYKYNHSKQVIKWMNSAKAVISVNYRYKEFSEQIVGKEKSYLVPHGIDENFFNFKADCKNNVPKIVTICSLLQLKNIDKVLFALNNIKTDFEYHIYGDGPDHDRLLRELYKLDIKEKVKFFDRIEHDRVPGVLEKYDIFVMPSYPENFGRVFIEAMAVGLPVIGAQGAGIDGYIEHGVSAFVVNHNDVSELERVLKALILNDGLREKIGREGKLVARKFRWENVSSVLDTIYSR